MIVVFNGQEFKAEFIEMSPDEIDSEPSVPLRFAEICTMSNSRYMSPRNYRVNGYLN